MLARAYIRAARTYVDPFDRICHGLGPSWKARNYRLERSLSSVSDTQGAEGFAARFPQGFRKTELLSFKAWECCRT